MLEEGAPLCDRLPMDYGRVYTEYLLWIAVRSIRKKGGISG